MLGTACIAVTFLLARGAHACLMPDDLFATLFLDHDNAKEAFWGLDVNHDGLITSDDLGKFYYHKDARTSHSAKKFLKTIDLGGDGDKYIDVKELGKFMESTPVKLAVYECKYINSKVLRKTCFTDQLVTYAYLALEEDNIASFFGYIESPKDEDGYICREEVKKVTSSLPHFDDDDIENFLWELGKEDKRITREEFDEYVQLKDLQDDFRACRKSVKDGHAVYDNQCLTKQLLDFTKNHITKNDVAVVFDQFDLNDSKFLKAAEVFKATECKPEVAESFIRLMDDSKDNKVSFGEFRSYVNQHSVKVHLEKECSVKMADQDQEIKCYIEHLLILASKNHKPKRFTIPDMDVLFLFEELDHTDNGGVAIENDLMKGFKWNKAVATRMVKEIQGCGPDENPTEITLEEFNQYVDEPQAVYRLAKCLDIPVSQKRLGCYVRALKDLFENMLPREDAIELFKSYDLDNDGKIEKKEVEAAGITGEKLDYFFKEMAFGDDLITQREFLWFVQQQEVSELFKPFSKAINKQREALLKYLATAMTEFDTEELFRELDKDGDHELDDSDFLKDPSTGRQLISKIDRNDDQSVNFNEFWLYINSPIDKPRKKSLEAACTVNFTNESEEIACYKKEILLLA